MTPIAQPKLESITGSSLASISSAVPFSSPPPQTRSRRCNACFRHLGLQRMASSSISPPLKVVWKRSQRFTGGRPCRDLFHSSEPPRHDDSRSRLPDSTAQPRLVQAAVGAVPTLAVTARLRQDSASASPRTPVHVEELQIPPPSPALGVEPPSEVAVDGVIDGPRRALLLRSLTGESARLLSARPRWRLGTRGRQDEDVDAARDCGPRGRGCRRLPISTRASAPGRCCRLRRGNPLVDRAPQARAMSVAIDRRRRLRRRSPCGARNARAARLRGEQTGVRIRRHAEIALAAQALWTRGTSSSVGVDRGAPLRCRRSRAGC